MTDVKVKSKAKKKPKLTEEEKRERVREALLRKKEFENRALGLVEQLLEPGITREWLVTVSAQLNQAYYTDAVEERSLSRLCGYPLCDKVIDQSSDSTHTMHCTFQPLIPKLKRKKNRLNMRQ